LPEGEEPSGPIAGPGKVLLGTAFVAYHWPLLVFALLWPARRVPFWAVAAGLAATSGMYAGLLLWLASPA
jgi:hypothetical protein